MYNDFRDEWLSGLAQRLQLPLLAFDDNGLCQLTLDQEMIITLHKAADQNYLVLFGQIPAEPILPILMQQLLIENRNNARLSAPVLSISENLDAIEVLYKLSEDELNGNADIVEQLVGNLEHWHNRVIQ